MDPVSRRLAAAAMGVAFGLSRDEELERTRLDLERARMEREDFRQGGGPDTSFMHHDYIRTPLRRKEYEREYKYMLQPRVKYQKTTRQVLKQTKQTCKALQNDLEFAVDALKRCKHSPVDAWVHAGDSLRAMGEDSSEDERLESESESESE